MWGFPAAFMFTAVLAPVVAIFLFRRRSREVEVPAVQLWVDLGEPVDSRSFAALLRRLFSLLMQVLLVMLLIVALADPAPARRTPAVTVLVIDLSATMGTREPDGKTRLDLAREEALRVVDALPADAQVVILAVANEPILKLPSSRDHLAVRQCLAALRPLDVDGDLRRAVRSALAFVNPAHPADVVVISDFAAAEPPDLRATWQSPARLWLTSVGTDQPDAAITSLSSAATDVGRKIVATVSQKGMAGRMVQVHLLVNDRRVTSQNVGLKREPVPVTFTHPIAAGDAFTVEVEAGDALSVDDRASGLVPRHDAVRICLVTDGNPPLERAIEAGRGVISRVVPKAQFREAEGDTVVVIDGSLPKLTDPGRAAGYLFINAIDPFGWGKVIGPVQYGPVTHWAAEHASMADIDPTVIRAGRGLGIDLTSAGGAVTDVVGADNLRVIAALEKAVPASGRGAPRTVRALYWAFDLTESGVTRRLTFPLLLWNAIDYLVDGGADAPRDSLPTGRAIRLREPPVGAEAPVLLDPSGAPLPARKAEDRWVVPGTVTQGIYRRADVAGEAYALNLLSRRGVNPLPAPDAERPDVSTAAPAKTGLLGLPRRLSWSWVLLAAIAIALGEWLLFHRRIVRIA